MRQIPPLPIDAIMSEITGALATPGQNVVVQAAPGAGKTTGIPLALLADNGVLDQRRAQGLPHNMVVLEPRKLAARMAATTCAQWFGSDLGDRIGYRVRFESAAGPHTQLCFVTQALYLRMLLGQPRLQDIGLVVFDEFHERNIASDLALALTLALQRDQRPDLQILAMSATLNAEPVANFLNAKIFSHEGKSYPVQTHHSSYQRKQSDQGPSLLRTLIEIDSACDSGHVLVFLPGLRSIEAQAQAIGAWADKRGWVVHRLHASMSKSAQQAVVAPGPTRKIILATNVAESSVTIPGVRAVVDFGLAKIARSDPWGGQTILEERKISRAAAIQRSGRAGRTGPGFAYRLYSEADFNQRHAFETPEIERLDPTAPILTIASLGYDPRSFPWFEAPKASALTQAAEHLEQLELMHEGKITTLGRWVAQLPLPVPAGRSVAELARADPHIAARVGALLSVDDKLREGLRRYLPASDTSDVLAELSAWDLAQRKRDRSMQSTLAVLEQHRASLHRTLRANQAGIARCGPGLRESFGPQDDEDWIRCALALGYVASLGKLDDPRQVGSRIVLARKGSARRDPSSCMLSDSPWVVVLSSRPRGSEILAYRLSAVQEEWLLELGSLVKTEVRVNYDEQRQEVTASQALTLGQLVLEEQALHDLPPAGVELLYKKTLAAGLNQFFDLEELEQLLARFAFVHRHRPEMPAPTMQAAHEHWRGLCAQHRRFSALKNAAFVQSFAQTFAMHLQALQDLAPTHIKLSSGRRVKLRYEGDREPGLSTRLQDLFGLAQGPRVMGGQVPVRLHLLAPNRRDVQVTTDLAGFWDRHYPALRKALMRRYPKHAWPEDPQNAQPPTPRPRRR